jgi:NADPH:quinone reductase-like Zn-dependent oxidoreductase
MLSMRRIVIHEPGGHSQLVHEQHPDLEPGPGQVRIAVAACGVNYADCLVRMGLYASARELHGYPITPGFEVAGRIDRIGAGVTRWSIGMPVMALTFFDGYASQVVLPEDQVFALPHGFTMAQAAAFPAVHLTAWYALHELAHPHAEDLVLIHSAAGGVGSALVQMAVAAGCRVIGVVGAPHKLRHVQDLGAEAVIDRSSEDLWAVARSVAPAGLAVILDANGAASLRDSYDNLAPTGKLVAYGFHSMLPRGKDRPSRLKLLRDWWRTPRFDPLSMTTANKSVLAFNLSFLESRRELLLGGMRWLLDAIERDALRPPTVSCHRFADVAEAHRELESGDTVGKLVLEIDDG